ncbi:unnamed protein product [Meganyctiphanes norvegica]|uniref:Calcium-activated chloride channel N-terminal domain-containing protein n=1 Tax=Meganyctiphanes norvegica TaxID=48144 RepID=A0AAV2RK49_MEGNR
MLGGPLLSLLVVAVALVPAAYSGGSSGSYHQGSLRLVDRGYEGLVVAVNDQIPYTECQSLLQGLKGVLTDFSSQLFAVTKGHASLRDVTVKLPQSWTFGDGTCYIYGPHTITASSSTPNVLISPSHLVGSGATVQQSQGCGRPGDFIQLGSSLIASSANGSYSRAAHLLLTQWIKFRWGVFSEHGYEGDPLYPSKFRDPVRGKFRANRCMPKDSDSVFCSVEDHMPEAPTKHNAQCRGRPVWEVITQSKDFKYGSEMPSNQSFAFVPSFHFTQDGPPRIVLVVEDTEVMNIQQRWEFLRKGIRRMMVYDVPDGARVGLIVFNSVARTAITISEIDSVSDIRMRIGSSLPRNPSRIPESHKCLLCGLQEAVRAINSDESTNVGGTVIFLTAAGGSASHRELEQMIHLAIERKIRVEAVLYPFMEHHVTPNDDIALRQLVASTEGSVFTIIDEGVGSDSKVSMMVALMDALLAAVRHSAPSPAFTAPLLVYNSVYPGGSADMAEGLFTLDSSLGYDVTFAVYYYDLSHVGNTIKLTSPSEKILTSVDMQEDGDANVIFVKLVTAERGTWRYQVENLAESQQALYIQVTALENPGQQVDLKVWTSAASNTVNLDGSSSPVIVYAELKDNLQPILKAQVVGILKRQGANATGSLYQPIYFDLYDIGYGDPDITAGDGVYSRYLPQLPAHYGHQGQYELIISVDNNKHQANIPFSHIFSNSINYENWDHSFCCGSFVHYGQVKPMKEFQRSKLYGVLTLASRSNEDKIPPSRILDLRTEVNFTTREVFLHWTAPGDDYDWGRAHFYEAVLAISWSEAKAFGGKRVMNMPVPLSVRSTQSIPIIVDQYDQNIYVAIRAVDEVGNYGGLSNIAAVWVPAPPTTTTPSTTTQRVYHIIPTDVISEPLESEMTQSVKLAGLDVEEWAIILGSVTGALIIIAVITIFCYLHVAQHRHDQNKKDHEKHDGNKSVIIKTNSHLELDEYDNVETYGSPIKTVEIVSTDGRALSPVPSWNATSLLHEHEKRHSSADLALETANLGQAVYQNVTGPFPDVTLISQPTSSAPPSSSTAQAEHLEYHASYPQSSYNPTQPYMSQSCYTQENFPPYNTLLPQLQNTLECIPEGIIHPSEMSYTQALPSYPIPTVRSVPTSYSQPTQFIPMSTNEVTVHEPYRFKVPPPVAPKPPPLAVVGATAVDTTDGESLRRNVTQV